MDSGEILWCSHGGFIADLDPAPYPRHCEEKEDTDLEHHRQADDPGLVLKLRKGEMWIIPEG
jgi:hypothetical protein